MAGGIGIVCVVGFFLALLCGLLSLAVARSLPGETAAEAATPVTIAPAGSPAQSPQPGSES